MTDTPRTEADCPTCGTRCYVIVGQRLYYTPIETEAAAGPRDEPWVLVQRAFNHLSAGEDVTAHGLLDIALRRQAEAAAGPRDEGLLWDRLSNEDKMDLGGLASQYPAVYNACRLMSNAAGPRLHGWTSTGCLCGHPWSAEPDEATLASLIETADTGGDVIHLAVTPTLRRALAKASDD